MFIVKYTEPGKTGLQTLVSDKGKSTGKVRTFPTRDEAECVAAARKLQKALVLPQSN